MKRKIDVDLTQENDIEKGNESSSSTYSVESTEFVEPPKQKQVLSDEKVSNVVHHTIQYFEQTVTQIKNDGVLQPNPFELTSLSEEELKMQAYDYATHIFVDETRKNLDDFFLSVMRNDAIMLKCVKKFTSVFPISKHFKKSGKEDGVVNIFNLLQIPSSTFKYFEWAGQSLDKYHHKFGVRKMKNGVVPNTPAWVLNSAYWEYKEPSIEVQEILNIGTNDHAHDSVNCLLDLIPADALVEIYEHISTSFDRIRFLCACNSSLLQKLAPKLISTANFLASRIPKFCFGNETCSHKDDNSGSVGCRWYIGIPIFKQVNTKEGKNKDVVTTIKDETEFLSYATCFVETNMSICSERRETFPFYKEEDNISLYGTNSNGKRAVHNLHDAVKPEQYHLFIPKFCPSFLLSYECKLVDLRIEDYEVNLARLSGIHGACMQSISFTQYINLENIKSAALKNTRHLLEQRPDYSEIKTTSTSKPFLKISGTIGSLERLALQRAIDTCGYTGGYNRSYYIFPELDYPNELEEKTIAEICGRATFMPGSRCSKCSFWGVGGIHKMKRNPEKCRGYKKSEIHPILKGEGYAGLNNSIAKIKKYFTTIFENAVKNHKKIELAAKLLDLVKESINVVPDSERYTFNLAVVDKVVGDYCYNLLDIKLQHSTCDPEKARSIKTFPKQAYKIFFETLDKNGAVLNKNDPVDFVVVFQKTHVENTNTKKCTFTISKLKKDYIHLYEKLGFKKIHADSKVGSKAMKKAADRLYKDLPHYMFYVNHYKINEFVAICNILESLETRLKRNHKYFDYESQIEYLKQGIKAKSNT